MLVANRLEETSDSARRSRGFVNPVALQQLLDVRDMALLRPDQSTGPAPRGPFGAPRAGNFPSDAALATRSDERRARAGKSPTVRRESGGLVQRDAEPLMRLVDVEVRLATCSVRRPRLVHLASSTSAVDRRLCNNSL
jgi:hypothetical protein